MGLAAFAAAALSACEASDNNTESTEVVASDGIEVSVSNVKDYSFDVTLTPQGEASYYSYAVIESDEAQTLDAETLYEDGYSSSAVSSGVFKYSATDPVQTVNLTGLSNNTSYWVYAVAGSTTGVVSEIDTCHVTTTDTGIPYVSTGEFTVGDSTITLVYSEPVSLSSSASDITLNCYAFYSVAFCQYRLGQASSVSPVAQVTVSTSDITISGSTVTVKTSGIPAGALISPVIPEGEFVDVVDNPTEAVTGENPLDVYGFQPTETFELGDFLIDTLRVVNDLNVINPNGTDMGVAIYRYSSGYGIDYYYHYDADAYGTVTFKQDGKTGDSYSVYSIMPDWSSLGHFMVYSGYPLFRLMDEQPAPGDSVLVTLNEGAFYDTYGNPSAAWSGGYVYDVDASDFYGTYKVTGYNQAISAADTAYIVLDCNRKVPGYNGTEGQTASEVSNYADLYDYTSYKHYEDPSKPRNIRFLYWLGIRTGISSNDLKGYVDVDAGTLSFPDITTQTYVYYPADESTVYMFMNYTQATSTFNRDATIDFDLCYGTHSEGGVLGLKNPSRDMLLVEGWSGSNTMYWFDVDNEDYPLSITKINDSVSYVTLDTSE